MVFCVLSFTLFSLPNKLFCVDNVGRTYILINWLGPKGLIFDFQQGVDGTDKPPPAKNSWVPTELINDGTRGSAARQRAPNLSTTLPSSAPSSSSSKPGSSSYAEKYLAKVGDSHVPKGSQDISPPSPMNSYAEIHRRKQEKKLAGYGGTSHSNSTSFSGNYALNSKKNNVLL